MKLTPNGQAAVLCVGLVVLGVLVVLKADTSDLMLVLLGVAGIGIGGQLGAVKTQTNGTNSALIEELRKSRESQTELMHAILGTKRPAEIVPAPRTDAPVGDGQG